MKNLDPKAVWLFFLQNSLATIILSIFFGCSAIIGGMSAFATEAGGGVLLVVLLCLVGVGLLIGLSYFWAVLTYNNFKYELTEDGFKKEKGVIFKKYTTIPYERIQNVDIYRGVLARMLGLSDLHIQTAGVSFTGQYGAAAEGQLPALSQQVAEELRNELVRRAKGRKTENKV